MEGGAEDSVGRKRPPDVLPRVTNLALVRLLVATLAAADRLMLGSLSSDTLTPLIRQFPAGRTITMYDSDIDGRHDEQCTVQEMANATKQLARDGTKVTPTRRKERHSLIFE